MDRFIINTDISGTIHVGLSKLIRLNQLYVKLDLKYDKSNFKN